MFPRVKLTIFQHWLGADQGLALLTLSWDKNWDSHSLVNGYPSFYPRIALVAPGPCDKPLSEPRMESLLTHICVTRPQWVKSELWHISHIYDEAMKQCAVSLSMFIWEFVLVTFSVITYYWYSSTFFLRWMNGIFTFVATFLCHFLIHFGAVCQRVISFHYDQSFLSSTLLKRKSQWCTPMMHLLPLSKIQVYSQTL